MEWEGGIDQLLVADRAGHDRHVIPIGMIGAGVFEGPQSVVFDEAENRIHAQKSILLWCFGLLGEG